MQVERLETLHHDAFIERVLSVHLTSVIGSLPPEELLPFGPVEHGERRDRLPREAYWVPSPSLPPIIHTAKMSVLNILNMLSPAPQAPLSEDYDGLQYRWKMFVFRPALFRNEAILFGGILLFLGWFYVGQYVNTQRANSTYVNQWFRSGCQADSQTEVVEEYHRRPVPSFARKARFIWTCPTSHVFFRSPQCSWTTHHDHALPHPRHLLAIPFVRQVAHRANCRIRRKHRVQLDPWKGRRRQAGRRYWSMGGHREEPDAFAGEALGPCELLAARKGYLNDWIPADPQTFPRLQEHSSVPITHALFSEHSDINDAVLKTPSVGVTELLANKQAASVLKYLLVCPPVSLNIEYHESSHSGGMADLQVTDQPANKPTKGPLPEKFKRREIVLAVYRPSSKAEIEAVNAWLQVALNIADLLAKPNLIRQDVGLVPFDFPRHARSASYMDSRAALNIQVARKLVKTREQVAIDLASDYNKYQAEETGALSKEEQAEEKRLAKKKAQREKLSEKELKKVEELEKKREARKMAKKQMMGK